MILTRDRDLIVVSLFFAEFRTQVTKEKYILVLLARRKKDAMSNISLKIAASHDILELAVMRRMYEMVEQAAIAADPGICIYILKCVTKGVSYDKLVAEGIPCSRDYFYDRYRKFFWILDGVRENN